MGYLRNRGTRQTPEWYIRFKDVDGKWKQRHSKQTTKDKAREVLAAAEERVKRGLVGIPDPTPEELAVRAFTVADLARRFLSEVEGVAGYAPPKIKSIKRYREDARKNFARLPSTFATRTASSLKMADVEQTRDELMRKLSGASVVQVLATLSKLFNWARKVGLFDGANPAAGVERPRTAQSIDYLDAAAVGRLLATAEELAVPGVASWQALTVWPMVATAIFAGLRKGELLGLRWHDVSLDAGRLDVLRSYTHLPKSGKARHVPINPELARTLRSWKERCPTTPEGVVFPVERQPGRFRIGTEEDMLGLTELLKFAECHLPADGHPWHMLRHTFASHFVMRGGSLLALQRLLGHSTPTMTMRYAHLAPDYLASEVARMTFAAPSPAPVDDLSEARRKRAAEHAEP